MRGRILKFPVTEIYAPMGARLSPNPSTKWHSEVILLVRLYPRIIRSATGDKNRVKLFMNPAVIINRTAFAITNAAADLGPIIPEGISLFLVLGLSASKFLSASLLNPIAALRAKIIQRIIRRSSLKLKLNSPFYTASENPIRAKCIAKTVWLNFTSDK